jgi:hypothetical protein
VTRDIPVSFDRRLVPPLPISKAFSATKSRAWYSFNVLITRNQQRSVSEGDILRARK